MKDSESLLYHFLTQLSSTLHGYYDTVKRSSDEVLQTIFLPYMSYHHEVSQTTPMGATQQRDLHLNRLYQQYGEIFSSIKPSEAFYIHGNFFTVLYLERELSPL